MPKSAAIPSSAPARAAGWLRYAGAFLFAAVFLVGFVDLFIYRDDFQGRTDAAVPYAYRFFLGMCMALRFYGHVAGPHDGHGFFSIPLAVLSLLGAYRLFRYFFRRRIDDTSEYVSRFEKFMGSSLRVVVLSMILFVPLYWLSNMAALLAFGAAMMTGGKYVPVGPAGFLVYSLGVCTVVLAMFVTPVVGVGELARGVRRLLRSLRS